MDPNKLLERVADDGDAEAANQLLKAFYRGFPIERLSALLGSEKDTVAKVGVWIASELGARAAPVLPMVGELLLHPDRQIRFYVLDTVLTAAGQEQAALLARAFARVGDEDAGVRWKATDVLSRASREQLTSAAEASDDPLRHWLEWLADAETEPSLQAQIIERLASPNQPERLIAAAAASRTNNRELIISTTKSDDPDVASYGLTALRRIKSASR